MLFQTYTFEVAVIKALALEIEAPRLCSVLHRAEQFIFNNPADDFRSEWQSFAKAIIDLNNTAAKNPQTATKNLKKETI
jgi:hypothetical protein